MARFPIREGKIKSLAQNIVSGLTANAAMYPAPPVTAVALQAKLDSFITLGDEAVAARAAAEQVTATKDAGLEELTDAMKAVLRYAEDTVNYDDPKLSLLGWGGKAAGTALEVPGQARTLEAPRQGEGWVFLDWKEPVDGGAVASYKIERRKRPAAIGCSSPSPSNPKPHSPTKNATRIGSTASSR
ncbi:MAG: hypothetical protein NTZ09_21855 [Candidatus Hydrogenedentes bacterium]|nr:hypothetical protein [Candidatus Hydrogenedentota bacterium]